MVPGDSRKHYRCAPDATHQLSAGLYRKGRVAFVGEVVDLSAGGMGVVFQNEDPQLEVDELVALLVTEVDSEKQIPVHSRVASVRVLDEEGPRLYGVEFDEPDLLRDELSQKYRRFFNLRTDARVWPALGKSIALFIAGPMGSVETGVEDISLGGMAFDVDAECGRQFALEMVLNLRFTLPATESEVAVNAVVKHCEPGAERTVVGVAFANLDAEGSSAVSAFIESRRAQIDAWQAA